ncbi:hypothetical protein PRK78_000636 [Emydomyces testavorans]|uniref:BZIP domain-containing protein n=1 Tax=Emydomyces testavorans TaxID=2070801 RepID=A0AAF0DCV3_9EURO|nr:hypothetical protein PRK78_000636 [Emydomyces testavorans]
MRSVIEGDHLTLRDAIVTTAAVDGLTAKPEPNNIGGSCSSSVSTPEPDGEVVVQESSQRQKRKGGRKPIYATSEERKQRNRQAQAAFRERRTEYIKQLEATIKLNEETLRTLQQSHRSAADECLMLRYKNSLLERILLEKGVDVQAELRLKSGSPSLPPARLPPHQPHRPPPFSQPTFKRNSTQQQSITQRSAQAGIPQAHREGTYGVNSPQAQQPTPPSHVSPSSATSTSPGYALQGGMPPTRAEVHVQHLEHKSQYHKPPLLPQRSGFGQGAHASAPTSMDTLDTSSVSQPGVSSSGTPTNHRLQSSYFFSNFQKHSDQMETEYDSQAMTHNHHESEGHTTSTNTYAHDYNPRGTQRTTPSDAHSYIGENDSLGPVTSIADHFDPMLDADPFGLSASMYFQTPFNFAQGNLR